MHTIETPLELVTSVADLRFPPKIDAHLQTLMDRNTEGQLSEAEREELEALVELSETIRYYVCRPTGARVDCVIKFPLVPIPPFTLRLRSRYAQDERVQYKRKAKTVRTESFDYAQDRLCRSTNKQRS